MGTKAFLEPVMKKQQQNISLLYVYKRGISNDDVNTERVIEGKKEGRGVGGFVYLPLLAAGQL